MADTTTSKRRLRSVDEGEFVNLGKDAGSPTAIEGFYLGATRLGRLGVDRHEIQDEATGTKTKVLGSTLLDEKMATVPIGAFCRIEYTGTRPPARVGDSPMKEFDVLIEDPTSEPA